VRRRRILTWAAAAVIAVAAGTGAWMLTSGNGPVDAEVQAQLDLRPYAIVRGESQPTEPPSLRLPRGHVSLTLLLPTGSESGTYDVEVRDSTAVSRASAHGNADLRNHVTMLDVAISIGSLSPGTYQLAVRHVGDRWQEFPVRIE
jgi:hypothetical protein